MVMWTAGEIEIQFELWTVKRIEKKTAISDLYA